MKNEEAAWDVHKVARVQVGPPEKVGDNFFYAIRFGDQPAEEEQTYVPISLLRPLLNAAAETVTECYHHGDDIGGKAAELGVRLSTLQAQLGRES